MENENDLTNQDFNQGSLQSFKWGEDGDNEFFGVKEDELEGNEMEQVVKEVKEGEKTKSTPDKDEDKDEFDDDEFDTDNSKSKSNKDKTTEDSEGKSTEGEGEEGENKDEQDNEGKSENDTKFFTTLAAEMKEKNIFQNIELKDGEEIDEEKFFEKLDEEVESRVEDTFKGFFEDLDEDGKAFLKFKKEGGSTKDFIETYKKASDFPELDIEDPKNHEPFLKYYYREVEGLDDEDIADKLEWLKERGKTEDMANKYYPKVKEANDKRKEALLEDAKKAKDAVIENNKKFVESIADSIDKVTEVNDFTFTANDKKDLLSYITKPTIKLGKNNFITPLQKDLGEILQSEDKSKLLLLAKLLKTNFDTKDIKAKTKTETTKTIKNKLIDTRTVRPSSSDRPKKTLADYFG